ncbi:MAG: glycosyltransferase, partial [Nanoarchaeota archaeon]|nr:glycosyltransferase [Nanoarchaeota archaeon]
QIKGEPNVILLDFEAFSTHKDEIKTKLWELYQVDSLNSNWDFEEPMLWSWCVGILLENIAQTLGDKAIVAHFHEWLAGITLLYLKMVNSNIKTIFTTHATMLGRSLASEGRDLYDLLDTINPEFEAKGVGVMDKFTTERAAAQNASIFTTVSEITGIEAEKILGRKPEVLVLNGLDVDMFPTIEETSIKHVANKEVVYEYLTYHFFPYYTFDLKQTLLFFIMGRYEFKNKGLDVTIKALRILNEQLQKENSKKTVCVFFFIPNAAHGIKTELLENKNMYRHIKQTVDLRSNDILKTIVQGAISQDEHVKDKVFTKEFLLDMKKDFLTFRRVGNPLIFSHNVENEDNDIIKQTLISHGLDNRPDDKVKAIIYPVYLTGNDGLLNLSLYETMSACHLGVFPSYYEPWGYTPLEAAAMGVSSITSDLSGFGRFIQEKLPAKNAGIFINKRYQKSDEEVVEDLAGLFHHYARLDHAERVQNKINAKNLSYLADWKHLIKRYVKAHNLALEK